MRSRIDVITGYGVIGLEIRPHLKVFFPDSYVPEVGSVCCFVGDEHMGNSTVYFPCIESAKDYMEHDALASVPIYMFERGNRIIVKLEPTCCEDERRLYADISGFLFVTEDDLAESKNRKDAISLFYQTAAKTTKEFSDTLNREVYEYQAFLNYNPLPEESRQKKFYGNYYQVLDAMQEDFCQRIKHPAFRGDGVGYLFEHIEYGQNFTDIWVMAPDEYRDRKKYIHIALEHLKKEFNRCIEHEDMCALADIKRSYGELSVGFRHIPTAIPLNMIPKI